MTKVKFLRIDDRLIHGQVIVGWLPTVAPERLVVVNDKVNDDPMRQELMSLSVPPAIDLEFCSASEISEEDVDESTFVLVASPADALACLENGIEAEMFNVGGMHSKDGKEEIFEALHVDSADRKNFAAIIAKGAEPIFQPTPQNEPIKLGDIL